MDAIRTLVLAVLVSAALAAPVAAEEPAQAAIPDYQPVAGWFKPPLSLKLGPVSGVAP